MLQVMFHAARIMADGALKAGASRQQFVGKLAVADADLRRAAPGVAGATAGTPIAPLGRRLNAALARAAGDLSGNAALAIIRNEGVWHVIARSARLASRSGATVALDGDTPLDWRSTGQIAGEGTLAIGGRGPPH